MAVPTGVEFDHLGADGGGGLDLRFGRFDEERDPDAGVRQRLADLQPSLEEVYTHYFQEQRHAA